MTIDKRNADASHYYHENSTADVARMDASAVYGNLADAMKNAVVVLADPEVIETVVINAPLKLREDEG